MDAKLDKESEATVGDTISQEDESFEELFTNRDISRVLEALDARTAKVVDLCLGLSSGEGMTLAEVGERIGITAERTRQIRDKGLKSLRKQSSVEMLRG